MIGLTLLIGLTVTIGTVIGVGFVDVVPQTGLSAEPVVISVTATAEDSALWFRHEAGPPIDVRTVSLRLRIDGIAATHQPPIPFFAATGFASGPTGPFNPATDPVWSVGETTSLRLAGSNHPPLRSGSTVEVTIVRDGLPIVRARTTAT